jgi:hypothetical protein
MPLPSRSQRARAYALWPLGVALTSWHYMWRTTPMSRSEHAAEAPGHEPPPLPDSVRRDDIQALDDGAGDLFHRRYRVRIRDARHRADTLMARLLHDLNQAAPTEFARFHRADGAKDKLSAGDDYVVHMPGPWNGPVRVVDVTPTSFRLATLEGHLEAGQIEFRAVNSEPLEFEIESWARSGDSLSMLLYQHLHMAKEVQLHMWTSFLEKIVQLAGGGRDGRHEVETHRVSL